MIKETTTTLNGESGATYFFNISPWDCLFQPLGAVYTVLSMHKKINTYTVLYIGETSDLSTLLGMHRKKVCLNYHRGTHFGVHIEPDREVRLVKEADLVVNYKPVCNS